MHEDLTDIRAFVRTGTGGASVADEEDIFAAGYVNSLFAVQLVMWLERRFGISAQGADLDLENFRSVERIARFVAARRGTPAAAPSPAPQ